MQTLNIFDKTFSELNSFSPLEQSSLDSSSSARRLALLEQLQTTLKIDRLLNIFAMEAAKYVDFSGLYFQKDQLKFAMRGSKAAKAERKVDLKLQGYFIGSLTYSLNAPISLANYKILEELHHYLLHPLHNALQYHQALQLAMEDGLTSLGNRRYFDEQLTRAMKHANRHQLQVGLIIADLNKFKPINDTYGHHIGDKVLIHFAQALKASVRDSDSLFRFGGDEFAILVENVGQLSLNRIENRIHQAVAQDALLAKYQVSCSLGQAYMDRADNEYSFFKRADKNLYQQKNNPKPTLALVE